MVDVNTSTNETNKKDDPMTTVIWYPETAVNGESAAPGTSSSSNTMIIIHEQKGNAFHLYTAIRKYTGATLIFLQNPKNNGGRMPVVKLELSKLYDALGLLRSLQYDVQEYNRAVVAILASSSSSSSIKTTTTTTTTMSPAEIKYASFRLSKQAAAFGVRLPRLGGIGTPGGTTETTPVVVSVPGLDSLITFIEGQYKDTIDMARTTIDELGMIDFDSLAEYYRPGQDFVDYGVGTGITSVPTMMRTRACYYARGKALFGMVSSFHLAMEVVVALGHSKYAVVEYQFVQSQFNGTRSIRTGSSSSSNIDMFVLPTPEVKEQLKKRGMQYQAICGAAADGSNTVTGSGVMVEYTAGSFVPTSRGSLKGGKSSRQGSYGQASRSGGRMIVDTTSAWSRGVNCAQNTGVASDVVVSTLKLYHQSQQLSIPQSSSDNYSTGSTPSPDADYHNDLLIISGQLPECLVEMTWPVVAGFSLQARTWGVAMVHGTKTVQFNETAFDSLVMKPSRKKLIRALVMSHEDKESVDLIAGKGEGSIFLLHGPPGVGKTLTAEAIAEMLHKPLYVVSMGELGTSPESLEERLQDILDLCIPWKALVLIDEAEMLLERRTKNDIVRNAMVCVMLRLLEYYSGILILTTNRVDSLDPAFQSRVTCALRYDALSKESRYEIWDNMMNRLGMDTSEVDVFALAKVNINGRQIKNTLQLALALARHEKTNVTQEHLLETLAVTTSFLDHKNNEYDEDDDEDFNFNC